MRICLDTALEWVCWGWRCPLVKDPKQQAGPQEAHANVGMRLTKAHSAKCVCVPFPSPIQLCPWEGEGLSQLCQECSCSRAGQGKRAACCPEGGWKGVCCQLRRGLSPAHCPCSPPPGQHRGQVAQKSFQRQPQLRNSKLGICFSPEGQMKGEGVAALCQQLLPRPQP